MWRATAAPPCKDGHDSSPPASRRCGEGAGRPGLARCLCVLPFRRSRPAPRGRFPHALRLAALLKALPDHRRRPCGPRRAADMTLPASAARTTARGEQAEAIHRPPQGPPNSPSSGLHRSTTARRHRGTWIRRPPHRRDGPSVEDGLPMAGRGRCIFLKASRIRGLAARDMLTIGGLSAQRHGGGGHSRPCGTAERGVRPVSGHSC